MHFSIKRIKKNSTLFFSQNGIDIFFICCLGIFLPLFFYNLGNYSLVDFDEAWFAEVARNILIHRNPFLLSFNNLSFTEHPPLGFLLMAISFLFFGLNEFAARLPEAFGAFASGIVLYFLGKRLFNRVVGFSATCVLFSCVWFVLRARSANLDTLFLFFYLLSFSLVTKIKQNSSWFLLVSVSLAAVFLTKMLVGLSILIPIIVYLYIEKIKIPFKTIMIGICIFFVLTLPWILSNTFAHGVFFLKHVIVVGLRPFGRITPNWTDIFGSLTFQYLHYGIRKWYYPFLISFIGNLFFIRKQKQLISIYALFIFLLFGFLTNSKTEIWHLIPLYPFIGLFVANFAYQSLVYGFQYIKLFKPKIKNALISASVIFLFTGFCLFQIYKFHNEVRLFDQDTSGLAFTSKASRLYQQQLYLNADYFLPSAVFYSKKSVKLVAGETYPNNTLVGIINAGPKPFLLLTEKWKLQTDRINSKKYILLKEYKEYVLLSIE